MTHRDDRNHRNHSSRAASQRDPAATADRVAPGKRTLTMNLASQAAPAGPVQRKHGGNATGSHAAREPVEDWMSVALRPDLHQTPVMRKSAHEVGYAGTDDQGAKQAGGGPDRVHQAAADGVAGAGAPLPFLDRIQSAFGRHDVSSVQAHTDSHATRGARAMGAEAFTAGEHVAFAGGPSLHTAAHEAAHVVQQRSGVQLEGGVGKAGDRYEQHADAVAALVVQGKSAEALLEEHADPARPPAGPASTQQLAVQRRINIMPVHFLRGLNVDPAQATDAEINEYIRIAVWDDVNYVVQKAEKLGEPGRAAEVQAAMKDLMKEKGGPQARLGRLGPLIASVNQHIDALGDMQPYSEKLHDEGGETRNIRPPHRTTRYATGPLDGYQHTSLTTGKPEGVKWGNDKTMWSEFAKQIGPGVDTGEEEKGGKGEKDEEDEKPEKYETAEPRNKGLLPLQQLPWDAAKRMLPRPLINLIFDVRYQLESQGEVVIDERTPYELARKEKSPGAPGTLRSWHQDSVGVLPGDHKGGKKGKEQAVIPGSGRALHEHYGEHSQTGAGSSIGKGVDGPQGLAEYTGTGSDWEHNTKIVLDYVNKRVYLTLTHYQYWALVKKGNKHEFWESGTQELGQAQGRLNEFVRDNDGRPTLMSPWMEILMPTSQGINNPKAKAKPKEKAPVEDQPKDEGGSSSGHHETLEHKGNGSSQGGSELDQKIDEIVPSNVDISSEQLVKAQKIIEDTGVKTESTELQPVTLKKEQVKTLARTNRQAIPPNVKNIMMLSLGVLFVAILYVLFS